MYQENLKQEPVDFIIEMYKTIKTKFENEWEILKKEKEGIISETHSKYEARLGRVGETLRRYHSILQELELQFNIPENLKPTELRKSIDDILLNSKDSVYLRDLNPEDNIFYPYEV